MSTYDEKELMTVIQEIEAGESIASVAKRYRMNHETVRYYMRLYQEHGKGGLHSHIYNWKAEQKYEVLKYMHENHLSCKETSIQFGISGTSTIWQWERRFLENGIEGLEDKKKGRKPRTPKPKPPKTREEELLERIEDLEIENEYLKKLNALVAEREKRERESR